METIAPFASKYKYLITHYTTEKRKSAVTINNFQFLQKEQQQMASRQYENQFPAMIITHKPYRKSQHKYSIKTQFARRFHPLKPTSFPESQPLSEWRALHCLPRQK